MNRQERSQRRSRIRGAAIRQAILDDVQTICPIAGVARGYVEVAVHRELVTANEQERGTVTVESRWTRECAQTWPLQPCEVGK